MSAAIVAQIAATRMPQLAAHHYPYLMTVKRYTETQDAGGGVISGTPSDQYTNIPCAYKVISSEGRPVVGDKLMSEQEYSLEFPVQFGGARISIDPSRDRLHVNATSVEPEKIFKIIAPPEQDAIVWQVVCKRES